VGEEKIYLYACFCSSEVACCMPAFRKRGLARKKKQEVATKSTTYQLAY
jgi:hypothetical protein